MPLNHETAAFLSQLAAAAPPGPPPEPTPEGSRAGYRGIAAALGPGPAIDTVIDQTITGSQGEIPIRIYRDHNSETAPCLVYYHGGGWIIGDLETHDHQCRQLAQSSGITVISVDYRLAPEHPFPSGHIDSLDALRYIARHPQEFSIDPMKIAVGGDSAGGNLAAFVAISAREEDISLVLQILLYPVTDARSYTGHADTFSYPSISENAESPLLTLETMRFFAHHTVTGSKIPRPADDWRLSPILMENLSNLAPTYIAVCELDPLRDEGIAYAKALEAQGNTVTLTEWADQVHILMQLAPICSDGAALLQSVRDQLNAAFSGDLP